MNDTDVIAHLRDLVTQFKEEEQCLIKAIRDRDFKNPVFDGIDDLVLQIKEELGKYDVLKIDDLPLRNDLCAIRENKDFMYFNLLYVLNLMETDDSGNFKGIRFLPKIPDEKLDEILINEITGVVDPYYFMIRKMEIGALLVGKIIPGELVKHLIKIKECYIWGFDSAAAIYCRTLLEEGFREALKSKPEFKTPQQTKELEGWSLNWLLNHSKKKKYFYKEVIEKAYKLKENVNHIVHPTSAGKPKDQMSELEIIKDTFYILEMLFR